MEGSSPKVLACGRAGGGGRPSSSELDSSSFSSALALSSTSIFVGVGDRDELAESSRETFLGLALLESRRGDDRSDDLSVSRVRPLDLLVDDARLGDPPFGGGFPFAFPGLFL